MTDTEFLASVLADGDWHSLNEILEASARARGCGLTVHSRVSDLRLRHGWLIEQRSERTRGGRVASFYRMLARPLEEAVSARGDVGAASSSGPDVSPSPPDAPSEPLTLFTETEAA